MTTDWIYTLKPLLLGTQWVSACGDWLECDRQRASRLHDEGGALAVCRLKSALAELDTAAPERAADIRCFVWRFMFGLPIAARDRYGTFGLGELMAYQATKDLLIGNRVYPAGSPLADADVQARLKHLLDTGAVVETQEQPEPVKEVQIVKRSKKRATA
jgi:hypothetical protein